MKKTISSVKLTPVFLVVSATLLFSLGSPIGKVTSSSPMVLTFFRSLSGLAAFTVYGMVSGKAPPFKLQPRLMIGGVFYALTSLSFFLALNNTTAANATVLINTSPFFLSFLGFIFLNEKPRRRDGVILFLIFIGIILCFYSSISLNGSKGDLFALFGGFIFALLAIVIKKADPNLATQPIIWGNLFAVLITAPFLLNPGSLNPQDIPLFIFLGFFQNAAPFILYAKGQEKLGVMEASLFKLIEPIAATLWVAILVREIPKSLSVAGGLIVITALFLKTFFDYRAFLNDGKKVS